MSYQDEWEGTKKEIAEIVEQTIDTAIMELGINASRRKVNRLFLEAFCRNLVQNELKDMMEYIIQEEGI
jgi:hypothetical protein